VKLKVCAADLAQTFSFTLTGAPDGDIDYDCPSDFVYSGLYDLWESTFGGDVPAYGVYPKAYRPFEDNNLYRNFVFSSSDVDTGGSFTNGISVDEGHTEIAYPPPHLFQTNSFDPLLTQSNALWTWNIHDLYTLNYFLGCSNYPNGSDTVIEGPNGGTNLFGLPFASLLIFYHVYNDPDQAEQYTTLNAGYSMSFASYDLLDHFYAQTVQPQFKTESYYFARVYVNASPDRSSDPIPGHSGFKVTNSTPLLIYPFGEPFRLAGYARQKIINGDPSKYAYLGQYFDKAYMADANGNRTTNETGILSEYGEFLSTEPGTIILTTKPDGTQTNNLQGECTVHIIKLQLDVNHDGTMDLSYGGPDNTSYYNPFVFWINNDYDRANPDATGFEEDDFEGTRTQWISYDDIGGTPTPDCNFSGASGKRIIPSERDLEDFARLWICGIDSNLFASLPPGTIGELSWGDKGNADTNNPAIDLFDAADADGGTGYLSNAATAKFQTNYVYYPWRGRLWPGLSIPVFSNGWTLSPHLIWCGAKTGSGQLTLTITQGGTNTLAQTSAYIEIKDIKQMYERWTVGDKAGVDPVTDPRPASEDIDSPFEYPTNASDAPYILLVHDYDLPRWKKDRYAETAFKRLYWQGYQGRFGLFRWPGVYNGIVRPLDDSEFSAWRSGQGLLQLLTNLSAHYPTNVYLLAHGYGATVAGEALRLAGTNQVVNTYIALQGAVPVHAYDTSWPWRSLGTAESFTPNRYFWYYTNGAPPYFAGVVGAGAYINYFKTNDSLLTTNWIATENGKPDIGYGFAGTNFYKGIPVFNTPLLFPTNTYEIFSYCDEARCEAIGVQTNLGGPFDMNLQKDLLTLPSPTGGKYSDHNAEFKSFSADDWAFWRAVLTSLGLKQQSSP
jgi:hypothetical protein